MREIKKGATGQSIYFDILDSTSTTGARKTGLAYDTSGLKATYVRGGDVATAITLATLAAANSVWSSGGFKEVDSTNAPGIYRLDMPNAAFATGAESVVVVLTGASGMVAVSETVQLVDNTVLDAYNRLGAPAGASISADIAAVKTDAAAVKTKTDSLTFTVGGLVDANIVDWKGATAPAMTGDAYARLGAPAGASISADIAAAPAAVWTVSTRLLSAGTNIVLAKGTGITGLNDLDAAGVRAAAGLASANLDTQLGAISAKTTNLPSSPAAVGSAMTLTSGERTTLAAAIEAAIINDSDGEAVLQAITDKIASVNPDLGDLSLGAIASAVWTNGTRVLTAGDNIVLDKGTGITGFNDLSSSDVAAAAWDGVIADHLGAGTLGDALYQAATHAISVDAKAWSTLTASDVENAIWDSTAISHVTDGTFGKAMSDLLQYGDAISTVTGSLVMTAGKLWVLDETGNPLPHASDIEATIWDAAISDHLTTGTAGSALSDAATYAASADSRATSIQAKTDNLPSDPADASVIAAEFSALGDLVGDLPSASSTAAAILAAAYEGSESLQDFFRLARAALLGKANGLEGFLVHYRDAADTKNRIAAVVDANGNRTAVTLDPS